MSTRSGHNGHNEVLPLDRVRAWPTKLHMARMFDVTGWWSIVFNLDELARRHRGAVPALRRLDVSAALLNLPVDIPVPETSLRPGELRLLSKVPACLVERVDGIVIRRTSPPVTVDHLVLPATDLRVGLQTVTEFSTYCPRSIVVPSTCELTDIDLAEANFYGAGVYRADGDTLTELAVPEPMAPWPVTPASWTFAETLWEQLPTPS